MKKLITLSICSAMLLAACTNANDAKTQSVQPGAFDTTQLAAGATFYQCPMDPEILSDKEGSCSKCGMDLEQVQKK